MTELTNGLSIDGLQKLCIERGDKLIAANNEILKLREALQEGAKCLWDTAHQKGGWAWEEVHDNMVNLCRCEYRDNGD